MHIINVSLNYLNIHIKSQGVHQVNILHKRGSADKKVWKPL